LNGSKAYSRNKKGSFFMPGIKESSEVLEAAVKIMNDVAAAKENDGSLSIIEELRIAIADAPVAVQAALGAGEIPGELSDLTQDEAMELLPRAMAVSNAALRLFNALSK
jgi:hypothetical protein